VFTEDYDKNLMKLKEELSYSISKNYKEINFYNTNLRNLGQVMRILEKKIKDDVKDLSKENNIKIVYCDLKIDFNNYHENYCVTEFTFQYQAPIVLKNGETCEEIINPHRYVNAFNIDSLQTMPITRLINFIRGCIKRINVDINRVNINRFNMNKINQGHYRNDGEKTFINEDYENHKCAQQITYDQCTFINLNINYLLKNCYEKNLVIIKKSIFQNSRFKVQAAHNKSDVTKLKMDLKIDTVDFNKSTLNIKDINIEDIHFFESTFKESSTLIYDDITNYNKFFFTKGHKQIEFQESNIIFKNFKIDNKNLDFEVFDFLKENSFYAENIIFSNSTLDVPARTNIKFENVRCEDSFVKLTYEGLHNNDEYQGCQKLDITNSKFDCPPNFTYTDPHESKKNDCSKNRLKLSCTPDFRGTDFGAPIDIRKLDFKPHYQWPISLYFYIANVFLVGFFLLLYNIFGITKAIYLMMNPFLYLLVYSCANFFGSKSDLKEVVNIYKPDVYIEEAHKLRALVDQAIANNDKSLSLQLHAQELRAKRWYKYEHGYGFWRSCLDWCMDFFADYGQSVARPTLCLLLTASLFMNYYNHQQQDIYEELADNSKYVCSEKEINLLVFTSTLCLEEAVELSVSNSLPFLTMDKAIRSDVADLWTKSNCTKNSTEDCIDKARKRSILEASGLQKFLSIGFIFLIGLGLRNLFKL